MRDNLLGVGRFSPVIRRTPELAKYLSLDLARRARDTVGRTGGHLVARAASFLLLADSRASFQIEGERPPRNRLERWGRAVLQAGRNPLTLDEIVRLHNVLIEDTRFIRLGLRTDGVFLGERDHFGDPLPEFVGARSDDLAELMAGLLEANDRMRDDGLDPVLQAAATAFGFVYVHPFEDGNGRLHRCLVCGMQGAAGQDPGAERVVIAGTHSSHREPAFVIAVQASRRCTIQLDVHRHPLRGGRRQATAVRHVGHARLTMQPAGEFLVCTRTTRADPTIVATLIFARTAMRESEIVVRRALGASRARVVAQIVTEGLVLTLAAAVLGLVVAQTTVRYAWGRAGLLVGDSLPFWVDVKLEPVTIAYALLLALVAAAPIGLLPALKATGVSVLRGPHGVASADGVMGFGGVRSFIIGTQVALTLLCEPAAEGIFTNTVNDRSRGQHLRRSTTSPSASRWTTRHWPASGVCPTSPRTWTSRPWLPRRPAARRPDPGRWSTGRCGSRRA